MNGTYEETDIKEAVWEVIDTYTFFDHAYDKIREWSGTRGELQRIIVNQYTDIIPALMREVIVYSFRNIYQMHKNLAEKKKYRRLK